MWRRFAVGVLALSACTSARLHRESTGAGPGRAVTNMVSTDPTLDQILTTFRRARVRTVDQALAALNADWPDYLSHYALVYESFSIQKSSYLKPRVIADGLTGRTILTFNDEAAAGGRGAIESLTFGDDHRPQLREIAFDAETPTDEVLAEADVDLSRSFPGVKVSKVGIAKCAQCHTNNRSIWGNYKLWAGAYGSFDDNLFRYDHQTGFSHAFVPRGTKSNVELDMYARYRNSVAGRYLRLKPIEAAPETSLRDPEYDRRPNLKLLNELTLETFHEIVDDIMRLNPPGPRLKKLVLQLQCRFVPAIDQAELDRTIAEDGAASLETLALMKRLFPGAYFVPDDFGTDTTNDRFQRIFPTVSPRDAKLAGLNISPPFEMTSNLKVRFRDIGLDFGRYFMNLRRTSIDDGEGLGRLERLLMSRLIERDPAYWTPYDVSRYDYLKDPECPEAARR